MLIYKFLLSLVIGIILIRFLIFMLNNISSREKNRLFRLFTFSYSAILIFGFWSWSIEYYRNDKLTLYSFINKTNVPFNTKTFVKYMSIGFIFGFVFGFIDNFGLWFGMDALDPITPHGLLTKAGIGNTFSNMIGAILATFASEILSKILNTKHETPIWSNALGVGVGCLSAIVVSRLISNRK